MTVEALVHVVPLRQRTWEPTFEEQLWDRPLNHNDALRPRGEAYKGRAQTEGKITCHSLMNVLGIG